MAKRKQSRKQERQQRQEAAQRARWRNLAERKPELKFDVDFSAVDPDLLADVRGAFEPGGVISPAAMSELALDSHHLFDEPELKGVLANPALAANSFVALTESAGLELFDSDVEALAPLIFDLSPYLLAEDPDLRADLIRALQELRARLKRQRRFLDAGRAAMSQLLLQHAQASSWRLIGVVQRVVTSSIFAGFRMGEIEEEIGKTAHGALGILQAEDVIGDLPEKLHELLDTDPDLRAYLERRMDDMWDDGLKAVLSGDLEMSLMTPQEVDAAVTILSPHVTMREGKIDLDTEGLQEPFHALVEELLLVERRRELAAALKPYLSADGAETGYRPFLRLVHEALADETGDEEHAFRAVGFLWMALVNQAFDAYLARRQEEE